MPGTLTDKVALITGAGRGIGKATALKLAAEGASLVLASRTAAELEVVEQEARANGVQVITMPTDVTDPIAVTRLVEAAITSFGKIDILVNSAGVGVIRGTMELKIEEFDLMMNTNVRATFLMCQAVGIKMAEAKSGLVINLPGILGKAAMMNAAGYCASKWAVTGMTKAMALDFKRHGVKFTLMHFGGVDSTFWDKIDGMRVQRDKMLTVTDAAEAIYYAVMAPATAVLSELVLQPESHQL